MVDFDGFRDLIVKLRRRGGIVSPHTIPYDPAHSDMETKPAPYVPIQVNHFKNSLGDDDDDAITDNFQPFA